MSAGSVSRSTMALPTLAQKRCFTGLGFMRPPMGSAAGSNERASPSFRVYLLTPRRFGFGSSGGLRISSPHSAAEKKSFGSTMAGLVAAASAVDEAKVEAGEVGVSLLERPAVEAFRVSPGLALGRKDAEGGADAVAESLGPGALQPLAFGFGAHPAASATYSSPWPSQFSRARRANSSQ